MTTKVNVPLGDRSYEILIGSELLATCGQLIKPLASSSRALIISDSNVYPLYGETVKKALEAEGFNVASAIIPAGEKSKSGEELFKLYELCLDHSLDRKSTIIALGGGVVGDLAGYVAASFLRGIGFVQIPTSLLAMVDSSVGGKTGINLPRGKNLVGAFYQPTIVIADTDTLRTLPEREVKAGMAEVIKYGIIFDANLFDRIQSTMADLLHLEQSAIIEVIARSCEIKAEVVRQDERESGLRAILNFGHTLGHAVEAVTGYKTYLHGEAIAIGMAYAARLSSIVTGLRPEHVTRIDDTLEAAGLPIRDSSLDFDELRKAMSHDKKSSEGTPKFVLAETIGTVQFGVDVSEDALREAWEQL